VGSVGREWGGGGDAEPVFGEEGEDGVLILVFIIEEKLDGWGGDDIGFGVWLSVGFLESCCWTDGGLSRAFVSFDFRVFFSLSLLLGLSWLITCTRA
jgi:hypothetical protein